MSLPVTGLNELKEISKGKILELPSFYEEEGDKPFVVRVKRPSLLGIISTEGKIPNSLKQKATQLFTGGLKVSSTDIKALDGVRDLMEVFARETLVEPTMQEIEEAGLELTDTQLMILFNFAQSGMKALGTFRTK